jgi:hypothetical protein
MYKFTAQIFPIGFDRSAPPYSMVGFLFEGLPVSNTASINRQLLNTHLTCENQKRIAYFFF